MIAPERAEFRLATYGSLSPGEANHGQLAGLPGRWSRGTVRGNRVEAGWGAALGFPGLLLDPAGPLVDVWLFESPELPQHWPRLDAFEGSGYQRAITTVRTPAGDFRACIYVLRGCG